MISIIKKFLPLILSLLVVLTVIIFWEYIKLPYNNENIIIGEHYYNKYNPLNDKIRFLLLIIIPSLVYIFCYLIHMFIYVYICRANSIPPRGALCFNNDACEHTA